MCTMRKEIERKSVKFSGIISLAENDTKKQFKASPQIPFLHID